VDRREATLTAPEKIPANIAAQELLEAPEADRPAMLEKIAKALTRRLLKDEPGIGAREVSARVTAFARAVWARLEDETLDPGRDT
jgi:hypothetical protein